MSSYDPIRITQLEERLAVGPDGGESRLAEFEMLADLYLHADSHVPALETIERLLELPAARTLSATRRAALECKAIACRLAQGQAQAALAHCREVLVGEAAIESPAVRARLHLQCGDALFLLSRLSEARAQDEAALAIADAASELALSATAVNQLGRVAYREGDLLRARDLYEQAHALFRRLGDMPSCGIVRNNLGLVHKQLCEWEAAIASFQSSLEHYREAGRFAMTGHPQVNLGVVYQKTGQWERASECYRGAQQVFEQLGDERSLANVGIGLGNVARLQRRFSDAEVHLMAALARARSNDAPREEALALEFLGENDFDRGRPERALQHYAEAIEVAQRIAPEGDLVVELERRRAEALTAGGRLDEAAAACQRARDLARRTEDRFEYAATFRVAGEIALAAGHRENAIEAWTMAVALLTDCRERFELARTHLLLARSVSDAREGRRHAYRAASLFAELSASAWIDQAEQELERLIRGTPELPAARPTSLLGRRHRAPSLVACSPEMQRVESLARRAAATELSVLITGETGTGKELVARTIHSLSSRAPRPFLAVNCGALRAELALSQLFGHRRGAFTGAHAEGTGLVEAANGGTLFMDEVGELPHDVQVTMLRFLETGEYLRLGETQVRRADVRIIAATNRVLRGADAEKVFRRDLLFRLNEIEIRLPSLRERTEDIVPLARHFLSFYGGLDGVKLTSDAEAMLLGYGWPGNVRELENVMKRLAALSAGEFEVDSRAIASLLTRDEVHEAPPVETNGNGERHRMIEAHREAHGNKSRMAEILGISRKTLYARMKRLELDLS